ncbi:MAG TPA: SDR family NAD(P)-dependent oxidoreductase [Candidatus Binataceae bacterium]|nr:SDR family NAD(P)-dependent oxidoreductase [Candidatus Binataceae bacterium]
MELNGKVALVTGGSRGIGRAIAIALAEAGASVAINYKENRKAADETMAALRERGAPALAVRADVSSADDVASMASAVEGGLGPVAILVNNAGVARPRKVGEVAIADFDEAIRVNLRSAFLVTAAVLPAMRRAGWGRLIFISSTAANVGGVVGPHYAASKAGMIGLMHAYASQLVKEGITANVISPALIATDMVHSDLRVKPELIPAGRFGRPEEIAQVALMLVRNGYVTGQAINVNGGLYPTS